MIRSGQKRGHVCQRPTHARRARADASSTRPAPAENGAAPSEPLAPADDSPLLAAVLAAQKTYRFGEIELPPTIARAIEKMGFVDAHRGPGARHRSTARRPDLIGQAQTGTGKTAAFGIPIVEKVDPSGKHVQALVLTPTRELCVQVTEEIRRIGVFRNVGAVAIYGGSSMERQITALKQGDAGRGRHAGTRARPDPSRRAAARPGQHRDPGRGRPHARHGLHRRRRDDPVALPAQPPDGALQRHHAVRHPAHLRSVHGSQGGAHRGAARDADGRDRAPARRTSSPSRTRSRRSWS